MLLEALGLLIVSKLIILFVPLRKIAPLLGDVNKDVRNTLSDREYEQARDVKRNIAIASNNVPWKSVCLDQAMTAFIMLNKRSIPNKLCFGAKKNIEAKKLDAHAWIVCNDQILVGGKHSAEFHIAAFFSKNS